VQVQYITIEYAPYSPYTILMHWSMIVQVQYITIEYAPCTIHYTDALEYDRAGTVHHYRVCTMRHTTYSY
jgi:hypothetical protein